MNTPANALPGSSGSPALAPAPRSATRPFFWSVQSELWENRSIYIALVAAAGVVLFGFLVSMFYLPAKLRDIMAMSPEQQRASLQLPFDLAAAVIMGTAFIVSVVYALDALYGERRDRSILFWKSLPVSDLTVVLAKFSVPLVVIPLLTVAVLVATWVVIVLLSLVGLAGSGLSFAAVLGRLPLLQLCLLLLYHFLTMHVIWYAPVYGWLLLVSAWARRAPFLWAVLPPLALGALEKVAFNTMHFAHLMEYVFIGSGPDNLDFASPHPIAAITPVSFLADPGLWVRLAFAAAFLFGAARLRRYQGPC